MSEHQDLREELKTKGFVKLPRSVFHLDDVTVQNLRDEFDKLFAGEYDTGIYPDEIHWRKGISKENVTRELCNAWKSSTAIRNIVCMETIGKLACALSATNWTAARIGQDDVIWKPPNSSASCVGFHQDGTYISDNFIPRENNCLTMWIALDDCDIENGTLQYAPGSHLWTTTSDKSVAENVSASSFHVDDNDHDNDHGSVGSATRSAYFKPLKRAAQEAGLDEKSVDIKTVNVPRGEMLVHHQDVWHGSPPNYSTNRARRALVVHVLNGDVQWRTTPKRPHYIYGRYYIRGERHLRDDFFPVTYSKKRIDDDDDDADIQENRLIRSPWLDNGDIDTEEEDGDDNEENNNEDEDGEE